MSMLEVNNTTSAAVQDQMVSDERRLEALPQLLPIGFLIVLTNFVVFLLFYSSQSLRKPSNYLLLSLAICDFLNGFVNIPLFLLVFIRVVKGSKFLVLLCAVEVSHNFIAITAACHIVLITAAKYLAVMRPLKYHVIKKRTMLLVIGGAWIISALVAAAPIGWFSMRNRKERTGLILETAFNVFCLVAVFVVPYTFILFAYITMFRKVCKRNHHRGLNRRTRSRSRKKKKTERKCLIIFATMATVFVVCWFPWFVLRLIYSLIGQRLIQHDPVAMMITAQVFLIVRYLTSFINPLLYTFFKQDFWSALKRTVIKMSSREKISNSRPRTAG
ncbi:5-hydroxytryptamine receptor 2A-like [Orbicella faveolata]|uniref:5-hydroxytryptamine receptor 2A-like n=1 Tax=Orbicella faveolata TaxID=48498 RepID=UPI0009E50DAE|nr:5-hydroxytryptamine receptor 2A-like [Orbicella faveolata]